MSIAELSVRRPVTIVMVYILIIVLCCVFLPKLGIAMYPETTFPMISVMTTYSNVGPEEIDKSVTQVLTNQLTRIPGIKSINSTSSNGSSWIGIEFGYDQDLDEAADEIQSAITRVQGRLPDNCSTPSIFKFNSSSMPIMRLAVEGDLPLNELKILAEDTIAPLLERVDGVSSVDVQGGAAKQIRVDVHQNRLDAYGISCSTISQALAARNIQLSSGEITQNNINYEIVTSEYFSSLDDIRETIVTNKNGVPIRVDDVAEVYEAFSKSGRVVYINGVPGLYISVSNESGTNASTISKGIRQQLKTVNAVLPKGISVSVISDDTSMIDSTMNQVYGSAFQGAFLAMLIILLFLRNLKSSFIIGLSIPISILITLMCMALMDLTVNLMTMSGLILGMGMVVDSSIVILENIYIHREKGEKPAVAAILGSRNMINAIVASTLTTICVFVPLIIYKADLEMIGQMFNEAVITVVISLVASLFVAVTLVPALCGSILQINTRVQKPLKFLPLKFLDTTIEKGITALENAYVKALNFCIHNRLLVITLVISMLLLSFQKFSSFGMNLAPSSNADDQVNVTVTLPIGTNNSVVLDYLFQFQDIVTKECEGAYKNIIINSGTGNSGSIQINLPELTEQTMSPTDIKAKLTPYLKNWSDVTVSFSSGRGPGGGNSAINIKLMSNDAEASLKTANTIVEILKEKVPLVKDIATDFENGSPRFQLQINTEAASAAGVSVNAIATEIRTAINGITATTYYKDGNEYSIIVALPELDLQNITDLSSLSVSTAKGRLSLDNFVTFADGKSPQRIQREDGERVNHVTAALADGATVTEAQAMVESVLKDNLVLPDSVDIEYTGDARDIQRFGGTFIIVIVLAIFLVFAVMAAQFESLIDPFIIFFSIPLLAIGVVSIYTLTKQQFSLYSVVGVVALVGVVVNNGIVLVDYTNQLVEQKTPVFDACLEAGRNRLRPILMSTLTTVLGMVPMAFFPGEGAESMQPICITMVGGLMSGAFMTLFLSPVLYTLLNKRREKRFNDPNALLNQLAELDGRTVK